MNAIDTNIKRPVLDVILNRRSIRAFADIPVDDEKIKALLEAARWAPSAMNEQPWVYVYAKTADKELYQAIAESLLPGNKLWAGKAPLLIVSLARKNFVDSGSHNGSALHDTGMANYALSIQATALGLHTHMMGGFNHDVLKERLHLPENLQPVVIIAVGYEGSPESLPEALKQRELAARKRKLQTEFAFNQPL